MFVKSSQTEEYMSYFNSTCKILQFDTHIEKKVRIFFSPNGFFLQRVYRFSRKSSGNTIIIPATRCTVAVTVNPVIHLSLFVRAHWRTWLVRERWRITRNNIHCTKKYGETRNNRYTLLSVSFILCFVSLLIQFREKLARK